jgi:hypothetical protein
MCHSTFRVLLSKSSPFFVHDLSLNMNYHRISDIWNVIPFKHNSMTDLVNAWTLNFTWFIIWKWNTQIQLELFLFRKLFQMFIFICCYTFLHFLKNNIIILEKYIPWPNKVTCNHFSGLCKSTEVLVQRSSSRNKIN